MKNYKVTFERSNKTTGSDVFTANSKGEAGHSFRECYRHDVYKILSIEEEIPCRVQP